jgi:hypothetical protein
MLIIQDIHPASHMITNLAPGRTVLTNAPIGLRTPPVCRAGPADAGPDPVTVPAITRPATAVIAQAAATTKNPRAHRGRRRMPIIAFITGLSTKRRCWTR